MSDPHTQLAEEAWRPAVPMGELMDESQLRAAQDAAIFGAQALQDETDGLRVTGVSVSPKTPPGRQEVCFSDGKKVLLSKQQIAAIRMM